MAGERAFEYPLYTGQLLDAHLLWFSVGRTTPDDENTIELTQLKDYIRDGEVGSQSITYVHEEATTVEGGTTVVGWQDVPINTTLNGFIAGASRSGTDITLPAGTYKFEAVGHIYQAGQSKLRITDDTASTVFLTGEAFFGQKTSSANGDANIMGLPRLSDEYTFTSTTTIKLQAYVAQAKATTGFGIATDDGSPERYSSLKITKVGKVLDSATALTHINTYTWSSGDLDVPIPTDSAVQLRVKARAALNNDYITMQVSDDGGSNVKGTANYDGAIHVISSGATDTLEKQANATSLAIPHSNANVNLYHLADAGITLDILVNDGTSFNMDMKGSAAALRDWRGSYAFDGTLAAPVDLLRFTPTNGAAGFALEIEVWAEQAIGIQDTSPVKEVRDLTGVSHATFPVLDFLKHNNGFEITFDGVQPSITENPIIEFSVDGTTWLNTGYEGGIRRINLPSDTSAATSATTNIPVGQSTLLTNTTYVGGHAKLTQGNGITTLTGQGAYHWNSSPNIFVFGGTHDNSAIKYVRFRSPSDTNFNGGVVKLVSNRLAEDDTNIQQTMSFREEQPASTLGGSNIAGTQTRNLNVSDGSIDGVSLSTNEITLPDGVYDIDALAPAYQVNNHQCHIYNVTDAQVEIVGSSERTEASVLVQTPSRILGRRLTVTGGPKIFSLRHYTQTVKASNGLGTSGNSGEVEVYSQLKITKVG